MSHFKNNINVIETRFKGLGKLIEKEPNIEDFETTITKDNFIAASYKGKKLCSRHNPKREASKLVDRASFDNADAVLFAGFGLGWHVEEFAKRYPETTLIIAIPSLSLFKAVLEVKDFTSLFFQNRIVFLAGNSADAIIDLYKEIAAVKVFLFPFEPLKDEFSDFYESLISNTEKWLNRKEINRNTLRRFGRLWIHNFALNLSAIPYCSSLELWDNAFLGLPAILVAAGPSLKKEIPNIKKVIDKAIIVAVDTSLTHLLSEGINPDFTVVTDPQFWNSRHLDYCDCSNTILVSELSTHPSIFRKNFKHILLSASPFPIAKKIEESIGVNLKLKSGGSVATAAWGLIVHLGCSTLFTAGLDLGFPGGETHCHGSFFEKRMMLSTKRIEPSEKGAWSYLHLGYPYKVPDNSGGEVLTDQRMQIYINWFKEQAKLNELESYNLSQFGAKLEGIKYGSLTQLNNKKSIRNMIEQETEERIAKISNSEIIHEKISEILFDLKNLNSVINEAIKISEAVKNDINKGSDFGAKLKRLDEIDYQISNCSSKEIAGFIIQPLLEDIASSGHKHLSNIEIIENSIKLYHQLSESLNYNLVELEKASF